jgi:photosystem II stability/assembly factor-like uncharacterized protein
MLAFDKVCKRRMEPHQSVLYVGFVALSFLFSCSDSIQLPPMKLPQTKPSSTTKAASTTSQPAVQIEYAFNEGRDLFSIWGKSDTELFAVGDAATLLYSKDAGLTWQKIKLEADITQSLYSIWGAEGSLYIAGADGVLLRSRDDGKTWLQMRDIPKKDLFAVWGSGLDNIYVAGKSGTLLRSTDGSKFVALQTSWSEHFYGGWTDTKTTLVCGAKGTLLRSLDQGKVWEKLPANATVDLRSVWGRDQEIYSIGNLPPTRGIPPRTELISSLDGIHWNIKSFKGQGRAVLVDHDSVYALGAFVSARSIDKGSTWSDWLSAGQHEALRTLSGMWRASNGQLFLVGQRGVILRAESSSFSVLAGALPVNWYDAILLPDGALLSSGWQGNLLRWKDNALTLLKTPTQDSLEHLVLTEKRLFAFGSAGAVIFSEDNGSSWSFAKNINARVIRDVLYRKRLYVLSTDTLFVSNNGEQWATLWSDYKQQMHSLSEAEGSWFMVGEHGVIFSSRDANSWKKQESGTERDLFAVAASNPKEAFAVGAVGTILHTKDGGETWQAQSSGVTQNLLSVLALSPTEVLVTGTDGILLETKDAGETWSKIEAPGSFSLSSAIVGGENLYVVGDSVIARYQR